MSDTQKTCKKCNEAFVGARCKPCTQQYHKDYAKAKAQELAEYRVQYRKDHADDRAKYLEDNAEKLRAQQAEYRAENKERIAQHRALHGKAYSAKHRETNKESVLAYHAVWKQKNKHIVNASTMRRIAQKLQATPQWANDEEIKRMYVLATERTMETGIAHHVDHIVPLRSDLVCGLHCEANMQLLSASENASKSNRYWPDMP